MMQEKTENKIEEWLSGNYDEATKHEINELKKNDSAQLEDAFYKDLEFGTGGLRGIMGVGTNRMNKYTVGMATQGFANYLNQCFQDDVKVAITHDVRNHSREFAEITAHIFAANGIKVYLFESLRPTPELSFAIRHFKCQGGVVCTASHNPKEYNGYKAYWTDGGQLVPPHDINVIKEVEKIASVDDVKWSGGWKQRIPFQLTFGDRDGGMRGFRSADVGGARRVVGHVEDRYLVGRYKDFATFAVAPFFEAGKLWAGDSPFGVTTPLYASTGLSLLAASPPQSRRTFRADFALPVRGPRGHGWEARLTVLDWTRTFRVEPRDIFNNRERSIPSSVFNWP